jgi:hypothetical protein
MPLWGEDTSAQRLKVSAHTANTVVLGRLGLWEGSAFLIEVSWRTRPARLIQPLSRLHVYLKPTWAEDSQPCGLRGIAAYCVVGLSAAETEGAVVVEQ